MPTISVPFTNDSQDKLFWCWAAVAANAYNCFVPPGSKISQCSVVTKVQGNCNGNTTDVLSQALDKLLIKDGLSTSPTFDKLTFELSEQPPEPICAVITFTGNAVHYVAISEVNTDPPTTVAVQDPFLGPPAVEFVYADFVSNYGYKKPNGSTIPGLPSGGGVVRGFYRVHRRN
jgi:hypothetical protein